MSNSENNKNSHSRALSVISVILFLCIIAAAVFAVTFFIKKSGTSLPWEQVQKKRIETVKTKGNGKAVVPDLVGADIQDAAGVLSRASLNIKQEESVMHDEPLGTILSQDPLPGTEASKGDTIYVTVSQGPAETSVPDVEGMKLNDAVRALNGAGLVNYESRKEYTQGADAGIVLSVQPSEGASVSSGQLITLAVCAGTKASAANPDDYVGLTEADALMHAEEDRLIPVISHAKSENTPEGYVIRQSIEKNAPVMSGATIVLTVSDGEPDAEIARSVHAKLGMPETATGSEYKIVAEEETLTGFYEYIIDSGDVAPMFPYEVDVPVVAGAQKVVLRYYEQIGDAYIPRAFWTILAPKPVADDSSDSGLSDSEDAESGDSDVDDADSSESLSFSVSSAETASDAAGLSAENTILLDS